MDDAITISLHTALNYIEHSGTHVRMLFVDYSSEFNTIIPDILIRKLSDLGLYDQRRSSFVLSPHYRKLLIQDCCLKPPKFNLTVLTLVTHCSNCCPEGDVTDAKNQGLVDLGIASFLKQYQS